MPAVRLFAAAHVAAGASCLENVAGDNVAEVLDSLRGTYGEEMAKVLEVCTCWVNQQPATLTTLVSTGDEVAVLPPVSGG